MGILILADVCGFGNDHDEFMCIQEHMEKLNPFDVLPEEMMRIRNAKENIEKFIEENKELTIEGFLEKPITVFRGTWVSVSFKTMMETLGTKSYFPTIEDDD